MKALDEAFNQFAEVHDNYFVTLEDQDDRDAALGYLVSVERDVQDARHSTLAWLHDVGFGGPNSSVGQPDDAEAEVSKMAAELKELREKEKQEFFTLMARQEEQLWAKYQQQANTDAESTGVCSPPVHDKPPPAKQASLSQSDKLSLPQLVELSQRQYQTHVESMHLPPTDLPKFDGELLKYWQFIRLFTSIVDKETVPDEEKLMRLHQYTFGVAREAITHCLNSTDSTSGYCEARKILEERCGSSYAISQAWVTKVLSFLNIKSTKQLQSFADILRGCSSTLKAMECEGELNAGRTLRQIIDKLPDDMKRKWLSINLEITQAGCLPKLDDVLKLMDTEAAK